MVLHCTSNVNNERPLANDLFDPNSDQQESLITFILTYFFLNTNKS